MTTTWKSAFGAGLAVAVGLAGFGHPVVAMPKEPRPAFTIHIRNYARVQSGTLAEAEHVATAIFRRVGIETRWSEIDVSGNQIWAAVAQDEPFTLADIQVNILAETARTPVGVSDRVMGIAPGAGPDRTIVDVFDGKVSALFRRVSSPHLADNINWR